METPAIYHSERHGQHIMSTRPQEENMSLPPFATCDVCGHDNHLNDWPDPDVCPRCYPEHQPELETPRRRRPVPIAALPTKDRLTLQVLLQLSADLILRFHPSEQVGWLNLLLEQLDAANLAKYSQFTHANYVLQALRREISDRLETGRW